MKNIQYAYMYFNPTWQIGFLFTNMVQILMVKLDFSDQLTLSPTHFKTKISIFFCPKGVFYYDKEEKKLDVSVLKPEFCFSDLLK